MNYDDLSWVEKLWMMSRGEKLALLALLAVSTAIDVLVVIGLYRLYLVLTA